MLNELLQIVVGASISILSVIIPYVAVEVAKFIVAKREEAKIKVGSDKYEANKKLALDLVKIVDERFRIGALVGTKVEEFETLLLSKVSYLTKEQIDELRDLAVHTFDKEINKR